MKQAKLENLFDYLPKSKIKAGDGFEEGKYPFYTSSENQSKYLNNFQHGPGCLVFGTGGKASVHLTTSHFATSTDCITIKPKPNVGIDAGYVFQYFKGNMQVLENGFKGAGLKHISKAYLSDIQIPHPEEITDQIRIAHLLGKVEGLIAQRKQHLQQLDDLLKSVFLEMFGDPVRNEKGWDAGQVIDLCDVRGGKRIPKGDSLVKENTGFPYIKAGNIKKGEVTTKDLEFVTPEVRKAISRYTVNEGDVCITVVGANIGDVGIVPSSLHKASLTENANKLLIKDRKKLNNHYLAHYMMSGYVQQQIASSIRAAGVPKLAIFRIEQMLLLIPSINEQVKFEKIKKSIQQLRSHYEQSLTDLEDLYGALSQQAFKGELDLSRVPLPGIKPEEAIAVAPEPLHVPAEHGLAIDLPDTNNLLDAPVNPEAREVLIIQWLEAYRVQLGSTPFSVQQFMAAAQTRLAELYPDNDFALGANDYEHIKAWVFEALVAGTLSQVFDDTGNRIELKAVQA